MAMNKKSNLINGLILIFMVAIYGCSRDSDAVTIDFDNTIAVERPESGITQKGTLNVAVAAMISPKETFSFYRDLLDFIGTRMDRKVNLIQRKTYGEVNELFKTGQVDLAFICSGPYAVEKEKYGFEALATPIVREKPFYQSYLIVNKDSTYQNLNDLRNKVFAFTDPDSNTGALVPQYWLSEMGETPESFFQSFTFTYSHDNSIMAVARALVDGATVDGHKWEYFQSKNPIYSSRTRIIKKSEPFGSPPLVTSVALPTQSKEQIRGTIFSMHLDPEGKEILEKLMIDRFVPPQEAWYEPIRQMKTVLAHSGNPEYVTQKF
jgi:phosphate/phosphite/phosphonate ABC transporter binding protein